MKRAQATPSTTTAKATQQQAAKTAPASPGALAQCANASVTALHQRAQINAVNRSDRVASQTLAQRKLQPNASGLPDGLKAGVEALSGMSMDHVKVHYNSDKPAQLQAHAYAQGSEIHLAPGQEQHLPHEAWHVVQQAQGRVRPTMQMKKGMPINDDRGLESAPDVMGTRALQTGADCHTAQLYSSPSLTAPSQRSVIQRAGSGGEKIGFENVNSGDQVTQQLIIEGLGLLMKSWTEAKTQRKQTKDELGRTMDTYDEAFQLDRERQKKLEDIKKSGTYAKDKRTINAEYAVSSKTLKDLGVQGLTYVYDKKLSDIGEEATLLQDTTCFRNGSLVLRADKIMFSKGNAAPIEIATLRKGNAAFKASESTGHPGRQLYSKHGFEREVGRDDEIKEYVKDNRGAYTRRYAYVEKNYYQMMDFFMTSHMTGRFQQYMMAGGERKRGIHTVTTDMVRNVAEHPGPQLSDTQVAVAHQMYGSLPEQRGVSMTSTPKNGVTYANTGGNFRTADGFKLKIDLARIPESVLLLNHYGHGGVSSMTDKDYKVTQKHKEKPYDYKYKESALHARELFIEHIKPEWVVEIEHHEKGGYKGLSGNQVVMRASDHSDLFGAARQKFGGHNYEKGFAVGLTNGWNAWGLSSDPHYIKGKSTGVMVKKGYEKGSSTTQNKKDVAGHDVAFKETMEEKSLQEEMAPFHIGYMLGRTGRPMVKSTSALKLLLNEDDVVNYRANMAKPVSTAAKIGYGLAATAVFAGVLATVIHAWSKK